MSSRHRLTELLGMRIRFADGRDGDRVTDVRLSPSVFLRGQLNELVVEGLVVGKMRPGTLLGYDRHPDQGPWLIRAIVRRIHRHTGYLRWDDVARIDWADQTIHVSTLDVRDIADAGRH